MPELFVEQVPTHLFASPGRTSRKVLRGVCSPWRASVARERASAPPGPPSPTAAAPEPRRMQRPSPGGRKATAPRAPAPSAPRRGAPPIAAPARCALRPRRPPWRRGPRPPRRGPGRRGAVTRSLCATPAPGRGGPPSNLAGTPGQLVFGHALGGQLSTLASEDRRGGCRTNEPGVDGNQKPDPPGATNSGKKRRWHRCWRPPLAFGPDLPDPLTRPSAKTNRARLEHQTVNIEYARGITDASRQDWPPRPLFTRPC